MTDQTLEIVELFAENFKRLKAVRIIPEHGKMVKLIGRNGQGKTSVIDAIAAALGGKEHLPMVPVRVGQEDGQIDLNLGSLRVKLKFEKDRGSTLIVTNADGSRVRTPQQILDRLASELTLDPMEFMAFKASERIDAIKRLIPGFDFAKNARERKEAYDRRTDIGRDYKREKALLDSMPVQPMDRPLEIDVTRVSEELRRAEDHNITVSDYDRNRSDLDARVDSLNKDIASCKENIRSALQVIVRLQKEADDIPILGHIDTAGLHAALASAQDTNSAARTFDSVVTIRKTVERHQAELRRLDDVVEGLDDTKKKAVQEAKLPVDGLGFGDDDIEIDGLPFEQASGSQQLMVATAITMALRPTLRVILIRQGPLLDHAHLELVAKIAAERGYQLIVERIDDGKETGIIIEDGEVAGVRT